jgi:LytS/YehU family sensor histidine kinase
VTHGPARGHRGKITVDVASRGTDVHVAIENPGAYRGPRAGSHGLPTLERRLALAYDGGASLSLRGEGARTIATVSLPVSGPRVST